MKKLLLFATFIYFILGILTYHPDNKLVMTWASLKNGTVWNIWKEDTLKLAGVSQFNYPPLHYYLDKVQYFISKPIGGEGYYEWLSNQIPNDEVPQQLTRYSFAIKFPLMLFSFVTAYVIYLLGKENKFSEKKSILAAGIWLFNPITLYSIPIMGQNDVMAILFFLTGFLFLQKKQLIKSTLLFGLSASIKLFPLIWVPFILFYEKEISIKKRVGILLGSLVIYVLTLLPFISNPVFRNAVFSLGIDRFFIAKIDLGFNDFILIVPILLLIVLYGIIKKTKSMKISSKFLMQSSALLLINMIFLFFNHFHPQWFIWLIPFYIFWLLNQDKNYFEIFTVSIGVFLSWMLIIFLFKDYALILGLLLPLNEYLAVIPSISDVLLTKGFHVALYNNYGHSFLAGIGLIFLIYWFNAKEEIKNISLPKLSFSYKYKFIPFVWGILFVSIFIFSISIFANIIPTPLADNSPKIVEYPFFNKTITKNLKANHDNLSRIDFIFSDDELLNNDEYKIVIKTEKGMLIHSQIFNGFNIGYKSSFRIDFEEQVASKENMYIVSIIPPETSENPLRIASQTIGNENDFAMKAYYARPQGKALLPYVLNNAVVASKNVINQNIIVVVVAITAFWFAL